MNWLRPTAFLLTFLASFSAGAQYSWQRAGLHPVPPPSTGNFDRDRPAPVDYGWGTGVPKDAVHPAAASIAGASDAHIKGVFGAPFTWPIIPIHVALLPDGRVLNYGTDEKGAQLGFNGPALIYAVWDPARGTGSDAFTVLPNATHTDVFCGGFSLMVANGEMLLAGGNLNDVAPYNHSIDATNIFDPTNNILSGQPPMSFKRWYPTVIGLANGELVALGGRIGYTGNIVDEVGASTPEVYNESRKSWRLLSTATNDDAYGSNDNAWYYPRAAQAPNGQVFILTHAGKSFYLDPKRTGALTPATSTVVAGSDSSMPAVWYRPGRMLALRLVWDTMINNYRPYTLLVDITGPGGVPVFKETAAYDRLRYYSNTTILADGRVALNGGSTFWNDATAPNIASYDLQIWDPATEKWTPGATAQKFRLYHSTAMLLPDATVLTGGGGAPGPVNQLNAEIYYPPYLYKQDGSGELAVRPTLVQVPETVVRGRAFSLRVGKGGRNVIKRVALVRVAGATHDYSGDQRFMWLRKTQSDQVLTVTTPSSRNNVPPGYYMVFVFNRYGVPSVAKIVKVLV